VVVDDGAWHGHAGPTGSWELRLPPGKLPGPAEFQTSRRRGGAEAGDFYVTAAPTGSATAPRTVIRSATTIAWEATFEPIKRSLPHAYPWLTFDTFDLYPDDKNIVARMVAEDLDDGVLDGLIPDEFSRKLVIGSTDFALVLGSRIEAATSLDPMHRRVVEARLRRGEAHPAYGEHALSLVFPALDAMTWAEVHEARKLSGLADLRLLLAEIEEAAWSAAESESELDETVRHAYQVKFHEAVARLQPSIRGTATGTVVGVAIGLVTGPFAPIAGLGAPIVGIGAGVASDVASAIHGRWKYGRSWMAAADRLTRRPARGIG
jgi:hypothetical protein